MRKILKQISGRINQTSGWRSREGATVLGGVLAIALLQNPSAALAAGPSGYNAPLQWNASTSAGVIGYRLYYGGASGSYTNVIEVGNVTSNTVAGLAPGATYFFAVTAYDANGNESAYSNEIIFVPGAVTLQINLLANKQARLTVRGLAGKSYNILASQTMANWTVIGTVTTSASGSAQYTDVNATNYSKRFYRMKERP